MGIAGRQDNERRSLSKRSRKPLSKSVEVPQPFATPASDGVRVRLRSIAKKIEAAKAELDGVGVGLTAEELTRLPGMQSLAIATRFLDGGRERFVSLVSAAVLERCEESRKWMIVYADLCQSDRVVVSFDDVCAAAGVRPSRLMAEVVSVAMDLGRDVGNLVAALTHPKVVAAGVAAATHKDGIEDRKMLFQHQGFIPVAKNTIQINNSNSSHASANAQAAAQASADPSIPRFSADLDAISTGRPTAVSQLALPPADLPEQIVFDGDFEDAHVYEHAD